VSHPRLNEREHERGYRKLPSPAITPRSRHDLRHAHATHMLASGIHPKVASERLGHSKVGITLDLYSHVMPGMQEDCGAGGQCFAASPAKARAETHS
jgi:integrase